MYIMMSSDCHQVHQVTGETLARNNHWLGSTTFTYCLALTLSSFCTMPEGHLISISFAVESPAKPAITRLSLAERYPTAVFTVKYSVSPEAETTLIRAPMPSRLDFVPSVSMPIQLFWLPPSFRNT